MSSRPSTTDQTVDTKKYGENFEKIFGPKPPKAPEKGE